MTKLAPEWVRTSDPVIRSPARYRWTTAPASPEEDDIIEVSHIYPYKLRTKPNQTPTSFGTKETSSRGSATFYIPNLTKYASSNFVMTFIYIIEMFVKICPKITYNQIMFLIYFWTLIILILIYTCKVVTINSLIVKSSIILLSQDHKQTITCSLRMHHNHVLEYLVEHDPDCYVSSYCHQ